jgi:hypothetical protein
MKLIKRFKDRTPRYPTKYYENIIHPYSYIGGGNDSKAFDSGKSFSNVYEIYIYALVLGLRNDYRLPVNDIEMRKFIEIRAWKHVEVTDYLILSLLSKSNIDFVEIENMESKDVENELLKLKTLMEEYAHGGFDILENFMKEDKHRFLSDDFVFVELLNEL